MDISSANVLVTGGAGTLGKALALRRRREGWTGRWTVYSSDAHKHEEMRRDFPELQYVQGDIRNGETLYAAMTGHDIVIHAAACKIIPVSEFQALDTIDVNVLGSQTVCSAAMRAGIEDVIAISTDKACYPVNAYGASKMLMEKLIQEYARQSYTTQFHLVRYGNVLESSGSVIEAWNNALQRGDKIKITDPEMTRFWISPSQAVDFVLQTMQIESTGFIWVPKMPALTIGKLAQYTLEDEFPHLWDMIERIPLRPGEKMHETLLTSEEADRAVEDSLGYLVYPSTTPVLAEDIPYLAQASYSSDKARVLSKEELLEMLENG